jgi:hypothetical protein
MTLLGRVIENLYEQSYEPSRKGRRRNRAQGKLWPDEPKHVWQRRFYDFHVWSKCRRVGRCATSGAAFVWMEARVGQPPNS